MRLYRFLLAASTLTIIAVSCCGSPLLANPLQTTPNRIVSLSPGITEILFAIGLGPKVVGDTVFCDYPSAAKSIAKIGDVSTNYERVVALHPDLVVADATANASAVAELKRFQVHVLAVSMPDYVSVERAIETIGAATGATGRAALVVHEMETQRTQAARIAGEDHGPAPRVLVIVSTNPFWSAGAHTFVGDLIQRAGGVNVAASLTNYAPYSREAILSAQPTVVLVGAFDRAAFLNDPAMRGLPAVKNGCVFSVADDNTTTRPGPRLGQGLLAIAHLLHPSSK